LARPLWSSYHESFFPANLHTGNLLQQPMPAWLSWAVVFQPAWTRMSAYA
jgi:hypothetical protein